MYIFSADSMKLICRSATVQRTVAIISAVMLLSLLIKW
nr:MAG TPA: RAB-like GTPase activator [Caudoviricetes sp.]